MQLGETLDMSFEFGQLWVFWLLPLPILITLLIPPLRKQVSGLIGPFYFRSLKISGQKPKKSSWISRRNVIQKIVLSFVWIALVTALASPQFVGKSELKIKTARSFLVACDISFSMDTRDWISGNRRLSRWEAVKKVMGTFMDQRKSDQLGLIFFATNAYLQAPLTNDLGVVRWMLDETEVGMAGQTTGLGNPIGMGIDVFKRDSLNVKKVMLLLTDGVDSGSDIAPLDAANLARKDSITIYTLGIGSPSSSDLDENTLKDIANVTGGQYFRAIDQVQLKQAYATLNELEPIEYEEESYKPITLLYYYPLGFALAITLVYHLVMGLVSLRKVIIAKQATLV